MAIFNVELADINEVYRPYLTDTHRYQLFFGGSSSGKSCFLATRAVLDALSGRNVLVVRKVQRTLHASCWNEEHVISQYISLYERLLPNPD